MPVKEASLGTRTASGLTWQLSASIIRVVSSLGFGIVLARILPPEDFGIIGLAYIATGFLHVIMDLGFGPAIIQRQSLTTRHVRVCHTVSIIVGGIVAVGLLLAAGMIASLFNDHRVGPVLQVLALSSLITSIGITSQSLLIRNLAFSVTVRIEVFASIIGYGVVAVLMAVQGYGYWSLVGGTIAQAALSTGLSYAAERHVLLPLLARNEVRDLIGFSTGSTLTSLVSYVALRGDYFAVGRMMSATSLGFYSRAYSLMELPLVFFGSALSRVLFPAASRVQDEPGRFKRAYMTSMYVSIAVSLPISLAVVVLAPEIIHAVYGPNWAPTVPLLQILCLFGVFRMTYNTASAFVRAKGNVYQLLAATVVYGIMVVIGSWLGIKLNGLVGAAWAVGLAILGMWMLVVFFANKLTNIRSKEFGKHLIWAAVPGLLIAVMLGGVVLGLRAIDLPHFLVLLVALLVFCVATGGTMIVQMRRLDDPTVNRLMDQLMPVLHSALIRLQRVALKTKD